MVLERSGSRYVPSFSTGAAAVEKIVSEEIAIESWSSVFVDKEGKREIIAKLCNHRRLRSHLNQCSSDTCGTRKRAARNASFGILRYAAVLSRSSAVSETALL